MADNKNAFNTGTFTLPSAFHPPAPAGSSVSPGRAAAAVAGAEANQMIQSGNAAVSQASEAANQNLSSVDQMIQRSTAQVNADLNAVRSSAAAVTDTAQQLGQSARDVNASATAVGQTAGVFEQYAAQMEQDATFARANALPWLQTGESMLAMDENADGMAGEWARLYGQMSPDMLAASAGTNARSAASAAQSELLRSMARRGVSAGSGAVAAALGKLKEREASSVAAMMTNARQSGLSLQAEALKSGFAMALQASGLGKTFMDEALNSTLAAAESQGRATSALATQGSLQAQAANIVATQGSLFGTAGNLALGIAGQESSTAAANMAARTAATNTQVNAQAVAADYYSTQGGSLLSMLTQQGYNVLTTLFGKK